MARNLSQRFQQAYRPNAWRHLRALNCDKEKQAAVNLSVKSGSAGANAAAIVKKAFAALLMI
jgi:hypothetical protein